MTRGWLTLLIVAAATSCGSTAPGPPVPERLNVLFVGNSLTFFNEMPEMVEALAQTAGISQFRYEAVTFGGYSLEDHWNRGDALEAIDRAGWDVVVLQQGPSSLPESRVHLVDFATRFAQRIRAAGGRPALYMVWPPLERSGDWDGVTASYAAAAEAVDGILLPVGEAVRTATRERPEFGLLGDDEFHPTPAGSYLAALVICSRLTGRSPLGLSEQRSIVPLPAADAAALERIAEEANRTFGH